MSSSQSSVAFNLVLMVEFWAKREIQFFVCVSEWYLSVAVDLCGILFDEGILSCKCRGGGGRGKSLHNGGKGGGAVGLGAWGVLTTEWIDFTPLLIYFFLYLGESLLYCTIILNGDICAYLQNFYYEISQRHLWMFTKLHISDFSGRMCVSYNRADPQNLDYESKGLYRSYLGYYLSIWLRPQSRGHWPESDGHQQHLHYLDNLHDKDHAHQNDQNDDHHLNGDLEAAVMTREWWIPRISPLPWWSLWQRSHSSKLSKWSNWSS